MKKIAIQEVEFLAHVLAKKFMEWGEPIPDFGSRFPEKLESCLFVPFAKFGGKSLYKGLVPKSSILFYLMIKNHPFQNGNKRIAVTTLLIFLLKNNKWLKVDHHELYRFAKWIAASPPKQKDSIILVIESFIKSYLVDKE